MIRQAQFCCAVTSNYGNRGDSMYHCDEIIMFCDCSSHTAVSLANRYCRFASTTIVLNFDKPTHKCRKIDTASKSRHRKVILL